MTDLSDQLRHAPGCGAHEGTSTFVGHSVTTVRCLKCGAQVTTRRVHPTPTPDPEAADAH